MNLSQVEIRARLNMSILDDPSHKLSANLLERADGHQQAVVTALAIPKPNKEDVVLGRGKPYQSWPGNQLMLSLCDAYRDRYHSVERTQKNIIIEEVRTIIRSQGGRFLERVDGSKGSYWREVDPRISYRKIGHAFRSNSRRLTAEKNAEIAIAEEAARTRKSYEDVKAMTTIERLKSPMSTGSPKKTVTPPDNGSAPTLVLTNVVIPGDLAPSRDFFMPMISTHSPPTSSEHLLQLEARRKFLLEEERRLFEMRLEASMRSRASLSAVGPKLYGTAIGDPMISAVDMDIRSRLQPRMADQRSILMNTGHAGASQLRGFYDTEPLLMERGFSSHRRPYWMASSRGLLD